MELRPRTFVTRTRTPAYASSHYPVVLYTFRGSGKLFINKRFLINVVVVVVAVAVTPIVSDRVLLK